MHWTDPRFWRHFQELPDSVQQTARRNFEILKANPRHPSLRFRSVGRYWSARVGASYRAVAVCGEGNDGNYLRGGSSRNRENRLPQNRRERLSEEGLARGASSQESPRGLSRQCWGAACYGVERFLPSLREVH